MSVRAAIVLGMSLLAAGCYSYSDFYFVEGKTWVITNPRVLTIRNESPALPFETVEITPFIVDADGVVDPEKLDILWLACEWSPEQWDGCLAEALPLTLAALPDCPAPGFEQLLGETLPEPVSPCVIGRAGTPEYVVPLSTAMLADWIGEFQSTGIELTMFAGVPGGTSTDECAAAILHGSGEAPDDCLHADTILWLGSLGSFVKAAADHGLEVPGVDPSVVPEEDEPEHDSRISEFRVSVVEDGQPGEPMILERGAVIQVPLGAILDIEVEFEPLGEPLSIYSEDWYRTWGRLPRLTEFADGGQNLWTMAPSDQDQDIAPPEGRAWLYYVVHGRDWFWFGVETTQP